MPNSSRKCAGNMSGNPSHGRDIRGLSGNLTGVDTPCIGAIVYCYIRNFECSNTADTG